MTHADLTLGSPYTKPEIVAAFESEIEVVHGFFSARSHEALFAAPEDVWSPAENLVHLNQSAAPVIRTLTLPRLMIRLRFGKAKHTSRSLAEIRDIYVNGALAGGGEASGAYMPLVTAQTAAAKAEILATWREQGTKLAAAIPNWSERDLDRLVLPHPLLGKMTVREILFFTLYHNQHHVNDVQRLLGQAEGEWFTLAP